MPDTFTDCRTTEGVTVGLVDALISIARVLASRHLTSPEVTEALCDLADDEDVQRLFTKASEVASIRNRR
jgi:hypothetical protein